jgi:hypothetical protein
MEAIMPTNADYQVYVIESPSDKDIYHGVGAGSMLQQALDIAGIHATYRLVVNEDRLVAAFEEMLSGFLDKNKVPILHIIAHGNENEIALTSGYMVSHDELGNGLRIVNQALGGELIVCLSACEGYKLAKCGVTNEPAAFATLVGNLAKPSWADNIVGFTAFYYLMAKGKTIKEAVEGMKAASGNTDFKTIDGQELRQIKDLMAKCDPVKLRAAINDLKMKQLQGSI